MSKRFRTTTMNQAGTDPAHIVRGRVAGINLVNWTVDVVATFDRKRYFDVQVASPYLHFNNGEGISAFPEVGAVCVVCVPGDSSPPFVLGFVMPHELVSGGADDAPLGTRSHGAPAKNAADASFAGGRAKAKPGDISLRTRDGNFVTLHRGGVLSIGSTELAQRLYIPLNNLVTDIAENYAMHSAGGSISWGLQDGPSQTNYPTQHLACFRVFANEKYADIRIAQGHVYNPIAEPDGGKRLGAAGVGQGGDPDNPVVFEVTVSPKGFIPETGDTADATVVRNSVLKFTFDRKGNTLFRCQGNFYVETAKKLDVLVGDAITVVGKKNLTVTVKDGIELQGGAYTHIKGKTVRLGPGTRPVARLGDIVNMTITQMPAVITYVGPSPTPLIPGTPIPVTLSVGTPPAGIPALPISGTIITAEPTVLT